MVAVRKIMPKPRKLKNVLYLLPKESLWMTNSVIKMMLPFFV